jgi:hypothetical protein
MSLHFIYVNREKTCVCFCKLTTKSKVQNTTTPIFIVSRPCRIANYQRSAFILNTGYIWIYYLFYTNFTQIWTVSTVNIGHKIREKIFYGTLEGLYAECIIKLKISSPFVWVVAIPANLTRIWIEPKGFWESRSFGYGRECTTQPSNLKSSET